MALLKICSCCGEKNKPEEMMCTRCMNDISGIRAKDPSKKPAVRKPHARPAEKSAVNRTSHVKPTDPEATVIERGSTVILVSGGGIPLPLRDGDVIGRKAKGEAIFAQGPGEGKTVSRKHARVNYDRTWFITDLNSGNGTFVNDMKLTPGKPAQIRSGDKISFSTSSVEFTVKI